MRKSDALAIINVYASVVGKEEGKENGGKRGKEDEEEGKGEKEQDVPLRTGQVDGDAARKTSSRPDDGRRAQMRRDH